MSRNEKVIGISVENPKQAMAVIEGLVEVINVAALAFDAIRGRVENGDIEEAMTLLNPASKAIMSRTGHILTTRATNMTDEEIKEVLAKEEAHITPATKCAGTA